MGVVYRGEDVLLKRSVALKFLPPELAHHEEAKERFIREARAASALDHPHIGSVLDVAETEEGRMFIVMPYYDGETLKEKLAGGPLSIVQAVTYAVHIAEGLAAAHEAGIVHRDIKPANVMVTRSDAVKIVDFGLARLDAGQDLTKTGTTLGTTYYMSPEQVAGLRVDIRTDLWSLGIVLFEMLTGTRPFEGEYDQAVLYSIVNNEPPPLREIRPDVPAELVKIVERLLQKDPKERFPSSADLLRAFEDNLTVDNVTSTAGPTKKAVFAGAAVVALILIVAAGYFLLSQPDERTPVEELAVLPLVNVSGNADEEYFADGMTDALITELAQIEGLKIKSRQSVMRFKGSNASLQEIAQRLGVNVVLEGTILSAGGRVRVTTQLIDGRTDEHLWARNYERPLEDILSLQKDIAIAVAGEIDIQLNQDERKQMASAGRVDSTAYKLYLRGRLLRQARDDDSAAEAIEYLERSILHDSSFAPAYAELSLAHRGLGDSTSALNALEKALALDPDLPEVHFARAVHCAYYEWDLECAERAFRRALEINPGHSEIRRELGWTLFRRGRLEDATRQMRAGLELDPLSPHAHHSLAGAAFYSGDTDRAEELIAECLDLDPTYWLCYWDTYRIAVQLEQYDRAAEAVQLIPNAEFLSSDLLALHVALLSAPPGTDTREILYEANRYTEYPVQVAIVYLAAGRNSEALEWLEQALRQRNAFLISYDLRVSPEFAALRDNPRFEGLLKEAGF